MFPQAMGDGLKEVKDFIKERSDVLYVIKEHLSHAQSHMKFYTDMNRIEREFQERDYMYLRLQPFRQVTMALRRNLKLAPKFCGPYKVLKRVGKVAYQLDLPRDSSTHSIFHVSQMKKSESGSYACFAQGWS